MIIKITGDTAISILIEHMKDKISEVSSMNVESILEMPDEVSFDICTKDTKSDAPNQIEFRTIDGEPARLIADDLAGAYPLAWAIGEGDKKTICQTTAGFYWQANQSGPYIVKVDTTLEVKGESNDS